MVALALGLYAADRITKHWAEASLVVGDAVPVIGGLLSWSLHYNPGAAFSMGTRFTIGLSLLSVLVLVGLVFVAAPRVRSWLAALAVGALLAGVAGNLTDRLFGAPGPLRGHVVDFIAVRGFAIFNVADMAITGAAVLMILWSLRQPGGAGR